MSQELTAAQISTTQNEETTTSTASEEIVKDISESISKLTVIDNGIEDDHAEEKQDEKEIENKDEDTENENVDEFVNHNVAENHSSIGKRIRRTSEKLHDEGPKKYSRDQLLVLKDSAIGREKPKTIPDGCKNIMRSSNNNQLFTGSKFSNSDISLFPTFMKGLGNMGGGGGAVGGGGGANRMYKGRSSQKESRNNIDEIDNVKLIKVNLNIKEEVKLKESANAWKPRHLQKQENLSEDEQKTQELLKKFRSILNKLTPENITVLVEQVKGFTIDTTERLDGCIKIVFEKAISEPHFTETYAQMCKELGAICIDTEKQNFKRKLVTQCQNEFENHLADKKENATQLEENANNEIDKEKAEQIKLELEEKDYKIKKRALGTIRFIGELFKNGQLTYKIMHSCITILTGEQMMDEEALESLCKLLTTIGARMELEGNESLSYCFVLLKNIAERRGPIEVSSRIRFMIMDLIDLRNNKYKPRRVELKQKTMDEIEKEAEDEENKKRLLSFALPPQRKNNESNSNMGYNQSNDGGNANKNKQRYVDADGFMQTPSSNKINRPIPMLDTKKLNLSQKTSEVTRLGSASIYQQGWNNNLYASLKEGGDETPSPLTFLGGASGSGGSNQQSSNSNNKNSGGSNYGNKNKSNKKNLYSGRNSSHN